MTASVNLSRHSGQTFFSEKMSISKWDKLVEIAHSDAIILFKDGPDFITSPPEIYNRYISGFVLILNPEV
jgi:hypothetical protein